MPAVPVVHVEKTHKKGWGHQFAALDGLSPEDRGLTPIALANLPDFQPVAAASIPAIAEAANSPAITSDDEDLGVTRRRGCVGRNRRVLSAAEEDEEE